MEFRKKYGVGVKNHIYPKLLGLGPETKLPVTSDLETLTANKTNTLDGMMAFIYMDGNRFGKIRDEKCTSTTLYKNYQNKIQDGLRKPALAKLLEFAQNPVNKSFRTNNESGEIRLETLLWGGDELEIIVPAWQAFNTVQILNDIFDSNEAKFEGVNLTHAGAVIFCKHNLPILQVRKYAHELCDEVAKFGIPKEIDEITTEHNRIAFFHISEFDLIKGDVKNFIKQHQFPASAENFCFTAADLPELFYSLSQLKIIPSSKVHAIVTALHAEKTELYERLFERLKKLLGDTATTELIVTLDSLNNAPEKWMVVSDLLKFYGEE